jgi:hypothetical protein
VSAVGSAAERLATAAASAPDVTRQATDRRPLVLLHGGAPWQENGGAVFLDALAEHCGRPCVHLAISLDGRSAEVPRGFPRPVLQIPARGGIRGFGVLRHTSPWLERQVYWGVASPRRLLAGTRRVARHVAELHPYRLAVFLNAVEIPTVALEVVRRVGVPYVTMEWDLLDVAIRRLGLTHLLEKRALRALDALRRGAVRRGVASEGMETAYRERWGLDTIVLRQPARSERRQPTGRSDRPFLIAVCGNVYAVQEFRAFLAALERIQWVAAGRPIEVLVIGTVGEGVGPLPPTVRVTGWVSFSESLQHLRHADLGYCPYWFAEAQTDIVSTSFPSKMISYLTCGVPVFYHGPPNGSPARFLARYPAGVPCTARDPGEVAMTLSEFVSSPERLALARRAADAVLAHEFSPEMLKQRLAAWLSDREGVS